jgi:hypothetical protein
MRKFIDLILEAESILKQQVVDLVQQTNDPQILNKVLLALKSTDLGEKLKQVLKQDADASKMIDKLANLIVHVDGTVDEKTKFADDYSTGFVDTAKLLNGKRNSFSDIIEPGFPDRVFRLLAIELTAQGVGPGEIALAILSPKIKHSGRASGGGDLNIDGKAVEVKTTVSKGGRWSDARKANLNMRAIRDAITEIVTANGIEMPARVGITFWINTVRPLIQDDSATLDKVTNIMADGLFSHVDNSAYKEALQTGDANAIKEAVLSTGYDNYKKYAGFEGMLLIDVRGAGAAQYFESYDDMRGQINSSTIYLMAPESEAMPQVVLSTLATGGEPVTGVASKSSKATADAIRQQMADVTAPTTGLRPPGTATAPRDQRTVSDIPREKRK